LWASCPELPVTNTFIAQFPARSTALAVRFRPMADRGRLAGSHYRLLTILPVVLARMDSAPAIARPAPALRLNWRVAPTWLVIGLTFLGLALRLVHIGSRPLWLDEAYSQWFSAR